MNRGPTCRLIVDPPAPGSWNMAVDEALLMAAAKEDVATLRLYEWDEPTLSLGYFQRFEDRHKRASSRDCPVVRRQSGGGAILHDYELTYSLTLPARHPLADNTPQLYGAIHEVLMRLLSRPLQERDARWTVAVHPAAERPSGARLGPAEHEPFLCFERRAPGDVLLVPRSTEPAEQSWKIVGSAQRRHRGAILQHGSVLLARSSAAPELPGYCDLTGAALAVSTLQADFPTEVGTILGLPVTVDQLPEPIRQAAQQIARDKYGADGWTRRR
jgi:lipoate-protein ligase A